MKIIDALKYYLTQPVFNPVFNHIPWHITWYQGMAYLYDHRNYQIARFDIATDPESKLIEAGVNALPYLLKRLDAAEKALEILEKEPDFQSRRTFHFREDKVGIDSFFLADPGVDAVEEWKKIKIYEGEA